MPTVWKLKTQSHEAALQIAVDAYETHNKEFAQALVDTHNDKDSKIEYVFMAFETNLLGVFYQASRQMKDLHASQPDKEEDEKVLIDLALKLSSLAGLAIALSAEYLQLFADNTPEDAEPVIESSSIDNETVH